MSVTALEFVLALAAVVLAAAVQGTIGLGFNIVAVPVMSLINPLLAPVPQLILSAPQTVAAVLRERAAVDKSGVVWIMLGRLPGAAIGVWLLAIATDRVLDLMIGMLVLAAVFILASGVKLKRTRGIEFGTGVFAGVSSYVATIGGPPVALLYSREEGPTIRATLGVIFTIGVSITLTVRILVGDITRTDVFVGLALMPAAAVGFMASSWLKDRASERTLRAGIFTLSSAAALALLLRAALG